MRTFILTRTFGRRLLTLGLAAAAVLVSSVAGLRSVQAQSGLPEADQKALATYQLTLEKVQKTNAINKQLAAAMKTDPALVKEMNASNAIAPGATLDQAAAQFDKEAPHVVAIIKAGGLDAREYLLSSLATMFASMGANLKKSAPTQPLPDFISPANLDLADKNEALFADFQKNMSLLDEAGKGSDPAPR